MEKPVLSRFHSPIFNAVKLKPSTISGAVSSIIGILVLIGWVFHISILKIEIGQLASMKINTALEFILLGCVLMLTQFQTKKSYVVVSLILSSLIVIISFTSLIQTLFHINLGIDQLIAADAPSVALHLPYPGLMSSNTAACFVLFGFAFLGFSSKLSIINIIAQYFLNVVTAISSIALIGYLYGLSSFYNVSYVGPLDIYTALLLFFTSLTASWLQPSIGINQLFAGNQVGNIMANKILTNTVYLVLLFGILSVLGREFRLFSFNNGISLLVIGFLCAGLITLWSIVKWLNNLDKSRLDAEKKVITTNRQLKLNVKQRSEKLTSLLAKYRETEAKFKAAFEHSTVGIALVSLKGKWFQVNKRLCDMMGYKEQELITMSFENIYGDNRVVYPNLENELLANAGNTGIIERRYKCKDKTVVWISVNTSTVTNKRGGAIYFVSQFEDITKRKTAESNLKAAYKEIEKHVKIIQDIAWKQSHLIRRPLANLKGLSNILRDSNLDSSVLQHLHNELNALDSAIIEMADDAADKGIKQIVMKKRAFYTAN